MSWVNPPTFTDGQPLSASQLNTLVTDLNYLRGLDSGVNTGFREVALTSSAQDAYYRVVHSFDNLHLQFNEGNDKTTLRIYYDAVLIYTSPGSGGDHVVNVDLSTFGLTFGQPYRVRARWGEEDSAGDVLTLRYMAESGAAL